MNIRSIFILALTSMSLINAAQNGSKVTLVNKTEGSLGIQRKAPKGFFGAQMMDTIKPGSSKVYSDVKNGAQFDIRPEDTAVAAKTITLNNISPEVTVEVKITRSNLKFAYTSGKAEIHHSVIKAKK